MEILNGLLSYEKVMKVGCVSQILATSTQTIIDYIVIVIIIQYSICYMQDPYPKCPLN